MTLPARDWPAILATLARTYGARGLAQRATHETRRALGAFRAKPRRVIDFAPAPMRHPFAVDFAALTHATNPAQALARADRVLAGDYQAYRTVWRPLPIGPAAWHRSPNEMEIEADLPWWRALPRQDADLDVKDIWEPARFAWTYDLVRAWIITRDDRYAAAFHRTLADWLESSPPFRGVHWACGQESTIRAIALLYAEANLVGAPSSDEHAMARITSVLAATGERVADAIGHALSQRNNHGISEAVGLLALGARFRGTHPAAVHWASRGRRLLERLIREQFAPDGWYIQHSFNYLRVALDMCIVARRLLLASSIDFSLDATERLRAATELLLAVIDPDTGSVPNHGHNDGAFVHPITLRAYRDYRPVVTAACASFDVPLPANLAPDAEALAWLGLPNARQGEPIGDGVRSGASGWATARAGSTAVFLRAGSYTSRPGHLDALHVDVRLAGRDTVVDAGTFAYLGPLPWRNALAAARVHNGPLVDDQEPGVRGPRFLWLRWPNAKLIRAARDGDTMVLAAEIPDRVRRTVRVERNVVRVDDLVLTSAASTVTVRWLLHPSADATIMHIDGASTTNAARESEVVGWYSPAYGVRLPASWIEVKRPAVLGLHITCDIGTPRSAAPKRGLAFGVMDSALPTVE